MTETTEAKEAVKQSELEVVKGKMKEYFSRVVELLNREVNIATRYELKIRVETIQDLFKHMFGE